MTRITKKENPNWKRTSRPQGSEVASVSVRLPEELVAKWRTIPRKGQWVDSLLRVGEEEVPRENRKEEKIPVGFQIDAALLEKWRAIPDKVEWLAENIRNYEQKNQEQ